MANKNNMHHMKVSAGLGEEVLADMSREKLISRLQHKIEKMMEEGVSAEEMSRQCVDFIDKEKRKSKKLKMEQ